MFEVHVSTAKNACMLVTVACLAITPANAYDPQAHPHDNSGRQLAQVIPGLPHPVAPVAIPKAVSGSGSKSAKGSAPAHDSIGLSSAIDETVGSMNHRLSSFSTPVQLSPEAKEALAKGMAAAQGFSNIAMRRVSDCGAWVSVLFRNLNDMPRITPASAMSVPTLNAPPMRAIEDPGKGMKLIYTSEHRFRTVVGR